MAGPGDDTDLPTRSAGSADGARGPQRIPPQIEGYEVLGPLGEGGMGIVWRAVQRSTRREVALKLHGPGAFGSDKARHRFEREVELAARLEHPHIARVYDSGLGHGVYFYAMELVAGLPLDEYVAQHHLGRREALELMRTVCLALQHAHQRGVIHRDLKPSNILVTPDGQPHVLDFGLAKALLERDVQATVTLEGEVAGTPAYMSPEQAAGEIDRTDTRSDVYSLGVILYRLLTNEFPHDLSGTRLEVLRRIAEEEVRRPRQITKAVDKELEALLLKALAHDPEGRYPTAQALADDLRRYAAYEPIEARPMGSFGRMWRWCRRKPVVAGLAAAVVVALVAGTGISTYFGVVAQRRAAEATANAVRETEARKRETVQRLEAERQTRLAKEAADLAMQVTEFFVSAAEMSINPQLAKAMRSDVLGMQETDVGKRHPELIGTLIKLTYAYENMSLGDQDEEMQKAKFYNRRQAFGKDHPATLACMLDLAAVSAWQGKYAEAEDMARQLLEIRQRVLERDHPDTLLCMHNLAYVLDAQGKKDEAAALRKQAEDLRRQGAHPPPEPVDALKAETKSWPVQTVSLLSPSDARLFRVCGGQYGGEAVFKENIGCRVFGIYANKVMWSSSPLAARYWASVEFMFTKEGDVGFWMAGPGYGHSHRLGYYLTLSARGCDLEREGEVVQHFRLPEGFDRNKWHTAVASRDGNTLRLWIDDTLVMRYQDAAPLAGVLHSRFGFGSHLGLWDYGIWFRNLAIHASPLSLSEEKTLAEVPLVPTSDILPSPNKECLLDCRGSALLSGAWSSRQPENVHPDNGRLILCGPNAGPGLYRNEPVEGSFAYEVVMSYVAQVIPPPKDRGASAAERYLKCGGLDNNFNMFIACGAPPRWSEKELAMAIPAGWRVALPKGASGLNELAWVAGKSETCVAETPYYTPVGGRSYTVRLERKADTVRVFLDGKLLLQRTGPDTAKGPAYVGFMDEYHGVIIHSVRIYRIE